MGFFSDFFSRAGRVVRGQVNKGMDVAESATFEATLKQTVRDMKQELNRVVKASAEAISHHNRLEAQYRKYETQAAEWRERAKQAMSKGNEELARKALAKKGDCDRQIEQLSPGVEQARQTSAKLKEQVDGLKRRIEEAERNAGTLIARRNAARASKKVSQALAGVGEADNAFSALKGFEESVEREEAAATAYDQLSVDADTELAKEFAELDDSSVDADLEALKAELNKNAG